MSAPRGGNAVNANYFQNRSQAESDSIQFPTLNGTLSQSIPNFDICIAYNRDNGYSTATLVRDTLEAIAKVDVILFAEEKENFDPLAVESRIASSACLLVVLSLGTFKSPEVLFALSAADYYYKDESQVIPLHDAASCFMPGYHEQPAPFRKFFNNIFPFFNSFATGAAQEIIRRYDASKKQNRNAKTSTTPSNAVSLGIQEILDNVPTKQPTKRTSLPTNRTYGTSTTPSNSNSNTITNNTTTYNTSAVSEDPPHYFFPTPDRASKTVHTSSSTNSSSSTSVAKPKRIPTLKSLSRNSEEPSQPSATTSGVRISGSSRIGIKSSVPSTSNSSTTKPSVTRTTLTRSSDRTSTSSYSSVPIERTSRRTTSSGQLPSVGNVGVYPPSNSRLVSEPQEDHLDLQALEDAELQLALELSKHESTPAVPLPSTQDDEQIARQLQEQWNSESTSSQPVRSPMREQLSDELFALMLQDSENAPIHLQPVYDDFSSSGSETENVPSAYDLFDAPPIPMFPGGYSSFHTHPHHHHPPTYGGSNHHHYGNQVDVDNMSYEELLELEERMGKAKSEGATKQQISALPTRKVTKVTPDSKCSVCQCEYEVGQQVTSLPCFHSYHSECIENWLQRKKTCPECLKEIEF